MNTKHTKKTLTAPLPAPAAAPQVMVGIDVSKNTLDAYVEGVNGIDTQTFANDKAGHRKVLTWLRKGGAECVVMEPTATYEIALRRAVQNAGLDVKMANPLRVRRFAQALGNHAKNDRLDAKLLHRYGQQEGVEVAETLSKPVEDLRAVVGRRRQLVEMQAREQNRMRKNPSGEARRSCERSLEWLKEEIKRLDAECEQQVSKEKDLAQRAEVLCSVKGVGKTSAYALLCYLPELGRYGSKAIASLAGLAPWSRDSGQHQGMRRIGGGRSLVRTVLYMPALIASRYDPEMRSFYKRLLSKGKPKKVALTAVMRKMLVQLNAIAKRGTPWVAEYQRAI